MSGLESIEARIAELSDAYYSTVGDSSMTYGSSRVKRARIRRDICILSLIRDVLESGLDEDGMNLSPDGLEGYCKLMGSRQSAKEGGAR